MGGASVALVAVVIAALAAAVAALLLRRRGTRVRGVSWLRCSSGGA
ncbi:MAG: hypothetical protein ACLP0J_05325 [Solirubrobacteraceae bacterium]